MKVMYRVKWLDESESTWELEENVPVSLVRSFNNKRMQLQQFEKVKVPVKRKSDSFTTTPAKMEKILSRQEDLCKKIQNSPFPKSLHGPVSVAGHNSKSLSKDLAARPNNSHKLNLKIGEVCFSDVNKLQAAKQTTSKEKAESSKNKVTTVNTKIGIIKFSYNPHSQVKSIIPKKDLLPSKGEKGNLVINGSRPMGKTFEQTSVCSKEETALKNELTAIKNKPHETSNPEILNSLLKPAATKSHDQAETEVLATKAKRKCKKDIIAYNLAHEIPLPNSNTKNKRSQFNITKIGSSTFGGVSPKKKENNTSISVNKINHSFKYAYQTPLPQFAYRLPSFRKVPEPAPQPIKRLRSLKDFRDINCQATYSSFKKTKDIATVKTNMKSVNSADVQTGGNYKLGIVTAVGSSKNSASASNVHGKVSSNRLGIVAANKSSNLDLNNVDSILSSVKSIFAIDKIE